MNKCMACGGDHDTESHDFNDMLAGNGELLMSFAEATYAFFTLMAVSETVLEDMLSRAIEAHEIAAVKAMQRVIQVDMVNAVSPIMDSVHDTMMALHPHEEH